MSQIISASLGLADAWAAPRTNFAVLVDGNRIVAIDSRDALRARYPETHHEHFERMLLTPALVNSHDHGRGLGTASLGIGDDSLELWLPGLRIQPSISPYLAAAYDGVRLLRSGVTLTAHSHNSRDWLTQFDECEDTVRGYRDAGMRVALHPVIVDQNMLVYDEAEAFIAGLPQDLRAAARAQNEGVPLKADDYFAGCEALYNKFHDATHHTAHIQVSPAGGQWCSDELILRAVDFAQAHSTRTQMHMLETYRQRQYAQRKWGKSFVQHLDEIGALGPWLTLAHMVWVEPDELALLAARGVAIAHNPSSNLRLRSGVAPLERMLQADVTTGIGLDGHALDDDQDYLRELRLAWVLANVRGQLAPRPGPIEGVSARAILHAGTAGGAAATFGQGAPLGSLAPGQLADLVLLDLGMSVLNFADDAARLVETVLHLASRTQVRHVLAHGEWVVREGRSTRLDEAALLREIGQEVNGRDAGQAQRALDQLRRIEPYFRQFYAEWDAAN